MRIFVISRLKGRDPIERLVNIERARRICRSITKLGHAPFAAHLLYPQFLDDTVTTERRLGIKLGHEFLRVCDQAWVYDDPIGGVKDDIDAADAAGIPVRLEPPEPK